MALRMHPGRKRFPLWVDIVLAVTVFLLAALGSWSYLTASGLTPGPDHGDSLFEILSAARWALGDAIAPPIPFPVTVPYVSSYIEFCMQRIDFCTHKSDTLRPEEIPPYVILPFEGDPKFIYDRIYLLYAMGCLWRMVGISWSSLNLLVSLFAGATATIGYGLFRLGMGRTLSLAGTALFVSSPLFLSEIPALRDFAKAPVILAAIWVVGYLLSHAPRKRFLAALAVLIGVITGIGMGFRQDILITVPPLLATFLFAPGVRSCSYAFRCGLTAVFLIAFLVPAYPVMRMLRQTGGNNSFNLTQGFTRDMLGDADTERASYGPLYNSDDFINHATISQYRNETRKAYVDTFAALRAGFRVLAAGKLAVDPEASLLFAGIGAYCRTDLDLWMGESEGVARGLVRDLAMTFPADVVTRWYGATARCLRGLQGKNGFSDPCNPFIRQSVALHAPLAAHFRKYGLLYAVLAFLVLAAKDLRLGIGVALLQLYFCGYTSLEFQPRHAFHLDFVSYWVAGFLLNGCITVLQKQVSFTGWKPVIRAPQWRTEPLRVAVGRMLAGACAVGLLLAVPLYSARLVQSHTVNNLIARYQSAILEPLPFRESREPDGNTLCAPVSVPGFQRSPLSLEILSEYLVLEFESKGTRPVVTIKYGHAETQADHIDEGPRLDHSDDCPDGDASSPATFRYFFPAYDFARSFQERVSQGYPIPAFAGIAVPNGVTVKGLYRVRDKDRFPILMNVWLPRDTKLFKKCLRLSLAS